ncbi:MAG: lysophospholipid acyltransferase family protein [Sedimenticola sp.]
MTDGWLWLAICLLVVLAVALRALYRACMRANRVDWGRGWMNFLDGLNRLFCYRYHRLNVAGIRLPKTGGAIVVSNHISGLDPMLLIASARRPLRFMIAREQYERFGLKWLFRAVGTIPVDRQSRPERALRDALAALQAGEVIALFPHGKIHLDSDPPKRLKPGVAWLAQQTGAGIYPARITGVSRPGHVLTPVIIRSQAKIAFFRALDGDGKSVREITTELGNILSPTD